MGTLIYRWAPPPIPDDVLDMIGTPDEYAVFDLSGMERENKQHLGGCIIFGWYDRRQEWMANVPARAMVMHLLAQAADAARGQVTPEG